MPPINPTKSSTLSYWWGWNICLKAKSSLSSFAPLCALCGSVVYSRLITTRAWVMTILISIPLNASLWVHRKSACDLLRSSLVHSRLCPRGASAGGQIMLLWLPPQSVTLKGTSSIPFVQLRRSIRARESRPSRLLRWAESGDPGQWGKRITDTSPGSWEYGSVSCVYRLLPARSEEIYRIN